MALGTRGTQPVSAPVCKTPVTWGSLAIPAQLDSLLLPSWSSPSTWQDQWRRQEHCHSPSMLAWGAVLATFQLWGAAATGTALGCSHMVT